jgi:hypothetical protein
LSHPGVGPSLARREEARLRRWASAMRLPDSGSAQAKLGAFGDILRA